jgi:peroxin-11B
MDSFDIWIPATNLGYTNLNEGVLGFLGWVGVLLLVFSFFLPYNTWP